MKTNGINICYKTIISKATKILTDFVADVIFYRHQMEPQVRGT